MSDHSKAEIPSEVLGRVLGFHAQRLPELVLTEAVGITALGGEVAALVVIALAEPCGGWTVQPPMA